MPTLEFRSFRNLDAAGLIEALGTLALDGGEAEPPAPDGEGGGSRAFALGENRRVEIVWTAATETAEASATLSLETPRRFAQKLSGEGLGVLLDALGLTGPEAEPTPGEAAKAALDASLATLDFDLRGGFRDDVITAGAGDDRALGRDGDDLMRGSAGGDDLFRGGAGRDMLAYLDGLEPPVAGLSVFLAEGRVEKPGGVDRLRGIEQLQLSDFADHVQGGEAGRIRLHLMGGADVYEDQIGTDGLVFGDDGDDRMRLGGGADWAGGGVGDDVLRGGAGDDALFGDRGADRLRGGIGDDRLEGGGAGDRLHGDRGDDRLGGQAGHDRLFGGKGDDGLRGGAGDDRLLGGAGRDTLDGALGADRYDGGAGADLLILDDGFRDGDGARDVVVLRAGEGRDVVRAMALGEDRFALDGLGFAELSFVDRGAGAEIRAAGEALALVRGVDAATLDDAALFL